VNIGVKKEEKRNLNKDKKFNKPKETVKLDDKLAELYPGSDITQVQVEDKPVLRDVIWLGNSKMNLRQFPKKVKKSIGGKLNEIQIQAKAMPKGAKPLKEVGNGVFEIALSHDTNAY